MPRRTHGRVGTDLWNEDSYRDLTCEEQWAYEFALLQPGLNRCGVVDYRPAKWAKLAKGLTPKRLDGLFRRINQSRHVVLDADFEELLVRTYVRHDGLLSQPMVVAAMVNDFRTLASPTIRVAFLAELRRIWHIPTLDPKERQGLALAFGFQADSPRVRAALGEGLVASMAEAIGEGSVEPFSEPFSEGLPEVSREPFTRPFTEPVSEPPCVHARTGARPPSGSGSGSGSDGSAETEPVAPPAAPELPAEHAATDQQPGGIAEPIWQARKRAANGSPVKLEGWDIESVSRVLATATERFDTDRDDAYERIRILAGQTETRNPGRLLEQGAWDWAGDELLRMARDRLRREQSDAETVAQRAHAAEVDQVASDRRKRIAALAEADPDGWAQAQVEAAAELEGEGTKPLAALVTARALDIHDRAAAS